ncbi:MAG: FkbM family methyltransferase [Lachnospiraceae bacterium]|nr:FkbM family methyltransferase [Lachnospiraceae bacterium]
MYNFIDEILAKPSDYDWILFGAGVKSAEFYNKYLASGVLPMPKYVVDNNPEKWGTKWLGNLTIEDPKKVMSEDYKKTVIIIATHWLAIVDQLRHMGAYYFMTITVKSIDDYIFIKDNKDRIDRVESWLSDDLSKELFRTKIEDYRRGVIYAPSCISFNPYYGNDVIPNLNDNDVIIAGGCYNCEHIDRALMINPKIKCYAFEPNAKYADLLRDKYKDNPNIVVRENGLFNENVTLLLDNSVDLSAHVVAVRENEPINENAETIKAVKLDDADVNDATLIWMDIEGSEVLALKGAENLIKKNRPKLAICVYHLIEHYVEVAECIKEFNPDYKLYFRHHTTMDLDSVLYAI